MSQSQDNVDFDALLEVIESLQLRIDDEADALDKARTRTVLVDPILNVLGLDQVRTRTALVAPLFAAIDWSEQALLQSRIARLEARIDIALREIASAKESDDDWALRFGASDVVRAALPMREAWIARLRREHGDALGELREGTTLNEWLAALHQQLEELKAKEAWRPGPVEDDAILSDEGVMPTVFLEIIEMGECPREHRLQVIAQANMAGIKYAGLTNGDRWELYDVLKDGSHKDRRILSISIRDDSAIDCAVSLLLKWRHLERDDIPSRQDTAKILNRALQPRPRRSSAWKGGYNPGEFEATPEIIELILESGTDLTVRDEAGCTALHVGVETALEKMEPESYWPDEYGLYWIASLLVNHGADIHAQRSDGKTAANLVAGRLRNFPQDHELLQVFSILRHGRLFSERFWFEHPSIETIRKEIDRGARITGKDDLGMTPLHYAVQQYHNYNQIDYLLNQGASINARNNRGQTPLHSVMFPFKYYYERDYMPARDLWHWKVGTVNLLIRHGADVNAKDKYGCTPLHLAVVCGSGKVGRMYMELIDHGADITAQDNRGETPLHYALHPLEISSLGIVFWGILTNDVTIAARDNEGRTPLHFAVMHEFSKGRTTDDSAIDFLLNNGADMEAKDNEGRTPLHLAIMKNHEADNIVRLLLERGADRTAADNDSKTAYELAKKQGVSEKTLQLFHG